MVAATPVLDELVVHLEDTSLCLVLADHDSLHIDTRFTDRRVVSAIERIGAVPGSTYSEEVSGTNSIATPYKTRQGLLVHPGHLRSSTWTSTIRERVHSRFQRAGQQQRRASKTVTGRISPPTYHAQNGAIADRKAA